MSELSVFDIAGPVMVGPSSSHTAGACKIGQFARALFHATPTKVAFYLHGSFGEVYKGHATDRALLGGVMKFRTSDPRIKEAFKVAKEKKIDYRFIKKDLGEKYHPNTVRIILKNSKSELSMIGSSVGGGVIEILQINNFDVHLQGRAGKYLSLIVCHKNGGKGTKLVEKLLRKVKALGVRVADVQSTKYKDKALTIIGTDSRFGKRITIKEVQELERSVEGIEFVRSLSKLEKQ